MGRPATLKVEIVGDASDAKRDLAGVDAAVGRVDRSAGKAGGGLRSMLGPAVITAALAVGGALLKLGKAAVVAASDAEQSMGAVESVFGSSAKQVEGWADAAADALGMSATEFRNAAVKMGASLQGMGFSTRQSAQLTKTLTDRAADMAATFGGTTTEAIDAMGSALRGETDPIEKYGVSIKQADIQARLAAQGQDKLTGAALKQAQAQAVLDIITEKTAKTQGAAAREADTYAGATARLKANTENLKAMIGGPLASALAKTTTVLARYVSSLNKSGAAQRAVKSTAATLSTFLRAVATPVANALKTAWNQVATALNKNPRALAAIKSALSAITPVARAVGNFLGNAFAGQIRILTSVITGAIWALDRIVGAFQRVSSWAQSAINAIIRVKNAIASLPDRLPGLSSSAAAAATYYTPPTVAARAGATGYTAAAAAGGITINVTGALDPEQVARQIRTILTSARVRRVGVELPARTR